MGNGDFESFARDFPSEIVDRVKRMTEEEAQARYETLRDQIVPTTPAPLRPGEQPVAKDLTEMQEYYLLQKRLGFM